MKIAYDGTAFHGWQKQKRPLVSEDEPVRTVEGVVEHVLRQVLRQPVVLVGASRTDAGVHARGQVAHFDANTTIPLDRLALAINSRLSEDIEVLAVEFAGHDFDAIRDAARKQYRYRIFNTRQRPLEKRYYVWHCWRVLDTKLMNDAARRLVGRYDFEGFAAASHGRAETIRTIYRCVVEQHDTQLHIVIEGDGFLYNMVRIVAGTLVEVGRGRLEPEVVDRVLASKNRRLAGPTLPARGLCLEWISYERQEPRPPEA